MRRSILGTPVSPRAAPRVGVAPTTVAVSPLHQARLDRRLRRGRSPAYVGAACRLDAGSHVADRASLEALVRAIEDELGDLTIDERPLGIVARCYLGSPYEVHVCDLAGSIIEHFETFRTMPLPFEPARRLALHRGYQFVEVYPGSMRAIAADGSVAVL